MNGKAYMARIHELRCVVCLNYRGVSVKCDEAHHLESVRGDHSDFATIPLCKACHDLLHAMHRKEFYRLYKIDDVKLLAWTIKEWNK